MYCSPLPLKTYTVFLQHRKLTVSFSEPTPPSNVDSTNNKDLYNESDYESIVLMRMRRAQEKKKLIEQIQQNDDNNDINS